MHVLDVNEIFWMPFYTYDRIMEEWGKYWPDAFALYVKLIKQSRIQQTNQTYTLNNFLENYFWWWHEKVSKVKNVLKKLWLIDDVVIRWEWWKLQWHYVRVNYLINEEKVRNTSMTYNLTTSLENRQSVSTTCGEMATNALSTQYINAWSNKLKNNQNNENTQSTNTQSTNTFFPKQDSVTPTLEAGDLTFEEIYNLFYHKSWRKSSKDKCKKVFESLHLDKEWYEMLVKDLKLFRIEYKYWIKDQQYRPKFETYVWGFNAEWVNEEYRLKMIIKYHMENSEDIEKGKKRYKDLCDTFWKELVDKLVKQYGKNKNKIILKAD